MQPVLMIALGSRYCSFAIADKSSNSLVSLVYYSTDKLNEYRLNSLGAAHPELNAHFYQVFVCYDFGRNMLLPENGHADADKKDMLHVLTGASKAFHLVAETLPGQALQNNYLVSPDIYEWVNAKFRVIQSWHRHSVWLWLQQKQEPVPQGSLWIDFRQDDFLLSVRKDGQLMLMQTFPYSTPADVLYYLLRACNTCGLAQHTVQLYISGLLDKQSSLYRDLYQYFIHIHFRDATWKTIDTRHPAHFFTALNDLSKCGS